MLLPILFSIGAFGISIVTAMIVTYLVRRPPSESHELIEIKARMVALDQEVVDVSDRLAQWMRREAVRKMRDGKELAAAESSGTVNIDKKAELRRRALQRGNTA